MDASSKLPWFPANFSGRLRVDCCKGINTRAGIRAYIVEFTVLTSNLASLPPTDPACVPVGSRRSWFQSLKEPGTAFPSCIAFLYAALGVTQANDQVKIDAEIKPHQTKWLQDSMSEDNVLAGAEVLLQTSNKKLKDKVTDFTLHTWSPAPAEPATA
jgi:hypothetical protein